MTEPPEIRITTDYWKGAASWAPGVLHGFSSAEDPENRLGDDHVFVGTDDSHLDAARVGGDDRLTGRISDFVELNAEETQAFTNAQPDHGRVLADATRKHERLQPSQGSGKGTDPLPYLVTEHRHWSGYFEASRSPEKTAADKQRNRRVLVQLGK